MFAAGRGRVGMGVRARVVAAAIIVVALAVGPFEGLAAARLSWLASVGFTVATLITARRVAGRLPAHAPARRFWWAVAANAAAGGCGYLYQTVTAESLNIGPVTQVLLGTGAAGIVVIMCTYPLGLTSTRDQLRFWLDMATVMMGAAVFGWYFSADGNQSLLTIVTGPVVLLVAVFAVAKLLIAGQPPFTVPTGLIGAGAAAIGALTGVAGPGLLAQGHAGWLLALSALGDACMMIAASVQLRQVQADPLTLQRTRSRPYSVLPYVAVAAVYGLLLTVATVAESLDPRTWFVLIGAAAITALVVIRQLTALADNARLLGDLRDALRDRDLLTTRLHDMAFHDGLTGLANRALFHDRLDSALAGARRSGHTVGVMLLDLDDFKPVNDRHGHAAGDAVLKAVALRLHACVREADTVARLGGDEFAVVLDNPAPDSLDDLAQRVVAEVAQPCWHDNEPLIVGASIGVATSANGSANGDQLLRDADAAMYAAKSRGKNSYATYPAALA
jgi:diguanylate cyclase